jgi:hypothetical protein
MQIPAGWQGSAEKSVDGECITPQPAKRHAQRLKSTV